MFTPYKLFFIVFAYLLLLFGLAYYAERKERAGKSIVQNPYVYALSLAVYCTSWTFYGSVGKAATSGLSFLTTYIGPTLMAVLWMVVLKKVVKIAKSNRITTISDFIGARYGKSLFLSALVTIVALVGIAPYLGLQIKAIITTFTLMSGEVKEGIGAGLLVTLILGVFAIIFGARRLDSSERHGGLVFAIAFESLVKLAAFLTIGVFVTYILFNGFGDITSRIMNSEHSALLSLGEYSATPYAEWFALTALSMLAVFFLPRQFQMAVVENYDETHIDKAAWLFPLYLLLINIFVIPIAFGGLLLGGKEADSFVLTLPLEQGNRYLALFAFIGGVAAATGMVIVETLALSTMVMNSIIMPALVKAYGSPTFPRVVLNIKRLVILGIVCLGYLFAISIGEFYTLVDMGMKSFEAVTLFAPAFLLGLYWKRGNKAGAIGGLAAGFLIWAYTLMIPAMMRAGLISATSIFSWLANSPLLDPEHLFGVTGLGKWGHTLFWSMLFNLTLYIGLSLSVKQSREEEIQALIFVESYEKARDLQQGGSFTALDIESIVGPYLGEHEARTLVKEFSLKLGKKPAELTQPELFALRDEAEKELAGAIGSAMAGIVFENKLVLTERERGELSQTVQHITENLRLSRRELAETNKELSYLKEFSENIIESAPVGIAIVDTTLRVKYWNKEIELLTGTKKHAALGNSLLVLIPWIPTDILLRSEPQEVVFNTPQRQAYTINVSPFKDPSGGFVIILEDITEKKKMEEKLLQTSKLASIGKLTAGISHEIGNPLASISSLVQELRALDMANTDELKFTKDSLRSIESHIERIARIVRSLADFARVSTKEKRLCSISEIFDQTITLLKYDKRFRDIELLVRMKNTEPLLINPDQMQQVFLNLMLNALDAMPEGGTLTISLQDSKDFVEIAVSDTGVGIDESVKPRIFDPFFTTKPPGKGTGLGLSICYGIISEHKGTISVESKRGKGTTFFIRLPKELHG